MAGLRIINTEILLTQLLFRDSQTEMLEAPESIQLNMMLNRNTFHVKHIHFPNCGLG
jgi:hypothetical protein